VPRTEAITRLQQADISFGSVADFEGTHSRSSALCQKRLAVCMPESGRERSRLSFRRLADQPEAAVGVGRRERGKRTHDGKAYIRKALPHRDFASTSLSVAFWMKSSICDTRARKLGLGRLRHRQSVRSGSVADIRAVHRLGPLRANCRHGCAASFDPRSAMGPGVRGGEFIA
jgi:hypothetical protein